METKYFLLQQLPFLSSNKPKSYVMILLISIATLTSYFKAPDVPQRIALQENQLSDKDMLKTQK